MKGVRRMHPSHRQIGSFPGLGGLSPIFPPFGPGGPGGGPPFGPGGPGGGPPFGPGGPGGGPPFGSGGPGGPPTSPPPSSPPPNMTSLQSGGASVFAVDPGGLAGCLYRFTFIRLNNGNSFWFYPTFIGRNSVAGYRWNWFRWTYFGIDTNRIASFQCV